MIESLLGPALTHLACVIVGILAHMLWRGREAPRVRLPPAIAREQRAAADRVARIARHRTANAARWVVDPQANTTFDDEVTR